MKNCYLYYSFDGKINNNKKAPGLSVRSLENLGKLLLHFRVYLIPATSKSSSVAVRMFSIPFFNGAGCRYSQ